MYLFIRCFYLVRCLYASWIYVNSKHWTENNNIIFRCIGSTHLLLYIFHSVSYLLPMYPTRYTYTNSPQKRYPLKKNRLDIPRSPVSYLLLYFTYSCSLPDGQLEHRTLQNWDYYCYTVNIPNFSPVAWSRLPAPG